MLKWTLRFFLSVILAAFGIFVLIGMFFPDTLLTMIASVFGEAAFPAFLVILFSGIVACIYRIHK